MTASYDIASSFKEFIVKNGVISTAASITIGFATATFVKSFVADVVMPLIFLVIVGGVSKVNKSSGTFISQFLSSKEFKFTNFVSELITWILIVVAAFMVLDLVVRKTLGNAPITSAPPTVFGPPTRALNIPAVVTVPVQGQQPAMPNAGHAAVIAPVPVKPGAVKEEYEAAPYAGGLSSFASPW